MATAVPASWAPSPNASTFATMKKECARYVLRPDDEEALEVAGEGINDGIRMLNSDLWPWDIQTQDITLSASDPDYSLNASFKAPSALELLNAASSGKPIGYLGFLDHKTFKVLHVDRKTDGHPEVYTAFNPHRDGLMQFNVPPSSAFVDKYPVARIHYYAFLALLESDGARPACPNFVEIYLKWMGKKNCATTYASGKYGIAEREERKAWRAMVRARNKHPDADWDEGYWNV